MPNLILQPKRSVANALNDVGVACLENIKKHSFMNVSMCVSFMKCQYFLIEKETHNYFQLIFIHSILKII